MNNTTPSPAAPQEVLQWARDAALECVQLPGPDNPWGDIYGPFRERIAQVFTRHAQPALAAATEEAKQLKCQVDYLQNYVIPEKDKHGKYWEDLAQQRIAQLAKHKAWGDKAREALQEQVSFLEICETAEDRSNLDGDSADAVLEQINDEAEKDLPKLKALLAAHPGDDTTT